MMTTPLSPIEVAEIYKNRGWAPIPVPYKTKVPVVPEWQKLRLEGSAIPDYFKGQPQNVGVLNGDPSGGLIDIDLDAPEAVLLAPRLLPGTSSVFGRVSKRRSHWLFVVNPISATAQYEDINGEMLLEYRSTGSQTIYPGSVHPTGEMVSWDQDDEPTRIDGRLLKDAVAKLAAATLIARHWPAEGSRQNAAMALAGGLLRAGWQEEDVTDFILAVGTVAGDDETALRTKVAEYTQRRVAADQQATGWPTLAQLIGDKVIDKACGWLGISGGYRDTDNEGPELDWAPLGELPAGKPAVPTMPDWMVPELLRPWLVDAAERACVPLEFMAVPAIAATSAVVGRPGGAGAPRS